VKTDRPLAFDKLAITLGVTKVDQIDIGIAEITADGFVERHPNAT
jgi:hypothetical protein